ncbi:hypothetical protein K435DRAFT_737535 [Dendrothele bispora CBS 962.96]|uniref:Fungal-type protein kinase domain-containing protein n=1 Tax=Dendrothele bispora (strain CBS 962.96) TaxID=1314807 RepID=A0A4S8KSF0_DENBC|nr:hypothetical protein K435DRAFT_737535 [Dendrothele bispora CBS 962.96]
MDNRFIGPLPVKDFLEAFLSRGVCGGDMPANLWTDAAKDAFKTVYTSQVAENSIRSSQAGQATDHSPAVAHTSNQSSEITQDSTHSSQTGSSSTRSRKPLETTMYRAMIKALEPFVHSDFEVINTSVHPDCQHMSHTVNGRADVTLYPRHCGREKTNDSAFAEVIGEFKREDSADVFVQGKNLSADGFAKNSGTASEALGQMIAYVTCQLAFQFRTHAFSFFVSGSSVRLIRWDRSGAVVSEAFKYAEEPFLAEFFWRFTRATPAARGVDTTVRKVKELNFDKELVAKAREGLGLSPNDSLFGFDVWNDSDPAGGSVVYLASKPLSKHNQSPVGRATRTYKAWDTVHKRVVLLKDTWRVDAPGIWPEGLTYEKLRLKGVRYIATCLRAGDVKPSGVEGYHRTATSSWTHLMSSEQGEAPGPLRSHIHYRLILEQVGRCDLTEFTHAKELVQAAYNGLIAHSDAYEKALVLHRDISPGNIQIMNDGTGMLIDWDLCSYLDDDSVASQRQFDRTGTWQFISAALVERPTLKHTQLDDLESFFHVLGWTMLRYTAHDFTGAHLSLHLIETYDWAPPPPPSTGDQVVASGKRTHMAIRFFQNFKLKIPPLRKLLAVLEQHCWARYEPSNLEEEDEDEALSIQRRLEQRRQRMASAAWMLQKFGDTVDSSEWPDEADMKRFEHVLVPPRARGTKRKAYDRDNKLLDPRSSKRTSSAHVSSQQD